MVNVRRDISVTLITVHGIAWYITLLIKILSVWYYKEKKDGREKLL